MRGRGGGAGQPGGRAGCEAGGACGDGGGSGGRDGGRCASPLRPRVGDSFAARSCWGPPPDFLRTLRCSCGCRWCCYHPPVVPRRPPSVLASRRGGGTRLPTPPPARLGTCPPTHPVRSLLPLRIPAAATLVTHTAFPPLPPGHGVHTPTSSSSPRSLCCHLGAPPVGGGQASRRGEEGRGGREGRAGGRRRRRRAGLRLHGRHAGRQRSAAPFPRLPCRCRRRVAAAAAAARLSRQRPRRARPRGGGLVAAAGSGHCRGRRGGLCH